MAQITFTIPDAKLSEFKTGFLKARPVPLNPSGEPTMTENQWIKKCGKEFYYRSYYRGKRLLWAESHEPGVDPDIID